MPRSAVTIGKDMLVVNQFSELTKSWTVYCYVAASLRQYALIEMNWPSIDPSNEKLDWLIL